MKQYDRLLNALSSYPQVLEENQKDMQSLDAFVKFLMLNEKEISKFSKITEEICLYLDNYNFAQGYVLDEIPNNLKPLHALRLALVKMGELSKELSVYPDRYELKKKIQVCKELTLTCMDKLGIGEIEKLTRLVIANTQKLVEVKELIENDDKVLEEIQSLMDSYMPVLQRFKAYLKEYPATTLSDLQKAFPCDELNDYYYDRYYNDLFYESNPENIDCDGEQVILRTGGKNIGFEAHAKWDFYLDDEKLLPVENGTKDVMCVKMWRKGDFDRLIKHVHAKGYDKFITIEEC